jgi:serine/threonine protein kinase
MTPQTIGRYTVLRELGHGAMGIVYEAEDPNIGRTVALKVVRTDQIGANRDEVVRRFKNEARAAGNLNHPNIITIHDAGEHEGMLFIAMECVRGENLADVMAKQARLASARVVDIVRQVCLGLDYAHARGIVHRDIKPANILLTDSLVKITDFGIANVGDGMTITGTVVGTPNYMSPEQVLGKPLDGRSDLFSVGVMLYEMVTGERPFEGQSITTIMYKIVHEEPIAPRKLDSSIHPGLSAVVEKALAKAPEARFQSGAELAAALGNYQQLGSGPITQGSLPTVDLPVLPETASISGMPAYAPATQPASLPSVAPPPTTQQLPPEKKKRGFLTTMTLGCFGVIALGIIAITAITIAATWKKGKAPYVQVNPPSAEESQGSASSASNAPASKVTEVSPPRPSQSKATLAVDSSPPGAEILLDGRATGKNTPSLITIGRGQHKVSVQMQGFQTASAKFKVSGGEQLQFSPELSVITPGVNIPPVVIPNVPGVDLGELMRLKELQKNGGLSARQKEEIAAWSKWGMMQKSGEPAIMINSQPSGARILLDGKDSGQTTPAVIAAEVGSHTVRLELAGYKQFEKKVDVEQGIPAAINAQLQPVAPRPATPPPAPPQ